MASKHQAYLSSCSSLFLVIGVLVQLIGLLLLVDFVEPVDLEELEVLQLRHLGQPGTAGPAVQTREHSQVFMCCGDRRGPRERRVRCFDSDSCAIDCRAGQTTETTASVLHAVIYSRCMQGSVLQLEHALPDT